MTIAATATRPRKVDQPIETIAAARCDADFADVVHLWSDYARWIERRVGVVLAEAEPTFAADLDDPRVAFADPGFVMIGRSGDRTVGAIGVRVHFDRTAEIRRFFVAEEARGTGVGRRLLEAAIGACADAGLRRIDLESLPRYMPAAVALYEQHGFTTVTEHWHPLAFRYVTMSLPLLTSCHPAHPTRAN